MEKAKEYCKFSAKFAWFFTKVIVILITIGAFTKAGSATADVATEVLLERALVFYSILIPGTYIVFFFIGLVKFHLEYDFKNKTWDDGF
ncbi:hypothetical protein [Thalassomonas sp. RHCl1]|uniref:hypothetical protein n=1 Tax=Thalassomonas sp. RHCl1 TaxID=2995320 RepID=UPI00248BC4AA|nr:hypothetical protein [Thalassomonas sp. RHCl1]